MKTLRFRAALLSLAMLAMLLLVWQMATLPVAKSAKVAMDEEYAVLMGKSVNSEQRKVSGFPTPSQFSTLAFKHLKRPFYDNGPNDKGLGIQLAYSIGRVGLGYLIACIVAIPLGLPDRHVAAAEQGARSVHPGAEADLAAGLDAAALYTIKDRPACRRSS
jgi:nitrate/nitrite transport system permease protein